MSVVCRHVGRLVEKILFRVEINCTEYFYFNTILETTVLRQLVFFQRLEQCMLAGI